jgi:DNA-binding NarL/FixJ family response regulator
MRVFICDDDKAGARAAIGDISRLRVEQGGDDLVIAGHSLTAKSAFRSLASTKFDVVIIDLYLPVNYAGERPAPPSGPWLARAITRADPGIRARLVMWSGNVASTLEGRNQSRAFVHQGGHHIIDKMDPVSGKLRTLEATLAGETWAPPADDLTKTEREILTYYAPGLSNAEIAKTTYRVEKTIEAHISSIRQKLLGVPTPDAIGRGSGAVIAAANADRAYSWLPIEHLGEPTGVFADIVKG